MKDLTKLTDAQLTAKNKQIGRILQAYPHRDGVNYVSLLDKRKAIADQLYNNSLKRVFPNQ